MATRYPGVSSFSDTELAYHLFFGREEECKKLFYYILSESLTILYSKSGYGKTSILQARVFKLLREQNYYPLYVRFNKVGLSPAEVIKSEILNNVHEGYEVIAGEETGTPDSFLENLEIWSPQNILVTPVLVLDQFEEMFTLAHNTKYRQEFAAQLAGVLGKVKEGRLQVKFVLSLREDYLGSLEKFSVQIPSILSNRFRLEALSRNAAREAIVKPGKLRIGEIAGDLNLQGVVFDSPIMEYDDAALNKLLDYLSLKLIENERVVSDEIEPVQLQIICSKLEEMAIAQKTDPYLVTEEILGGDAGLENILVDFYEGQMKKVTEEFSLTSQELSTLRELIENELILNGKRVPMEYESIKAKEHLKIDAVDSLIKTKLLRVENFGQNRLVEISHDTLIAPILISQKKRENKTSKNLKLILSIVVIVFAIGAAFIYWSVIERNRVESELAKKQEKLAKETTRADSLNKQVASITVQNDSLYLASFGSGGAGNSEMSERLKADAMLKKMKSDNQGNDSVRIEYFIKKMDQEEALDKSKLAVAFKDLGYNSFVEKEGGNPTLKNEKSNALKYSSDVTLYDVKIVLLALIRAGFSIKEVSPFKGAKSNKIQIITDYAASRWPVVTVKEIVSAKSIDDISQRH